MRDAIAEIRPHTLENVHENWFNRMSYCKAGTIVLRSEKTNLIKFQNLTIQCSVNILLIILFINVHYKCIFYSINLKFS